MPPRGVRSGGAVRVGFGILHCQLANTSSFVTGRYRRHLGRRSWTFQTRFATEKSCRIVPKHLNVQPGACRPTPAEAVHGVRCNSCRTSAARRIAREDVTLHVERRLRKIRNWLIARAAPPTFTSTARCRKLIHKLTDRSPNSTTAARGSSALAPAPARRTQLGRLRTSSRPTEAIPGGSSWGQACTSCLTKHQPCGARSQCHPRPIARRSALRRAIQHRHRAGCR